VKTHLHQGCGGQEREPHAKLVFPIHSLMPLDNHPACSPEEVVGKVRNIDVNMILNYSYYFL
jgi:hypothetical protein